MSQEPIRRGEIINGPPGRIVTNNQPGYFQTVERDRGNVITGPSLGHQSSQVYTYTQPGDIANFNPVTHNARTQLVEGYPPASSIVYGGNIVGDARVARGSEVIRSSAYGGLIPVSGSYVQGPEMFRGVSYG